MVGVPQPSCLVDKFLDKITADGTEDAKEELAFSAPFSGPVVWQVVFEGRDGLGSAPDLLHPTFRPARHPEIRNFWFQKMALFTTHQLLQKPERALSFTRQVNLQLAVQIAVQVFLTPKQDTSQQGHQPQASPSATTYRNRWRS